MLAANLDQQPQFVDRMNPIIAFPVAVEAQPDPEVTELLAYLSPEIPWGERQTAARRLGCLRNPEALPGLLAALPEDKFWMVRCSIIQALEMIGEPGAVHTLCEVAEKDGFQVVRSHAAKAVQRLSQ
jgi:HEAT repeat protein